MATDALFRLFLSVSSSSGEINLMCFFLSFFLGSSNGTTQSFQAQSFDAGWSQRHAACMEAQTCLNNTVNKSCRYLKLFFHLALKVDVA